MDINKEYIKMSEEADKYLQYEFQEGDFYVAICYGNNVMYEDSIKDISIVGHKNHPKIDASALNFQKAMDKSKPREVLLLRLHRQDQLQEMVKINFAFGVQGVLRNLLHFWEEHCNNVGLEYNMQFNSMEQLWLAFVMKEKYGKVWNGKEWCRMDELGGRAR